MNYRRARFLFVAIASVMAVAITGCGTTAHVEKDASVNFTKYKTYSWVSEKEKSLKRPQTAIISWITMLNLLLQKNCKKTGGGRIEVKPAGFAGL